MEEIKNIGLAPNLSTHSKTSHISTQRKDSGEFSKMLKKSIDELNQVQETSDRALADMASGQLKDLHQAAIAIGKAETSMKLMLEVRNKALSAYKEILRTQV
ncbi:flagellar hook-basal body complex protein FliE [uncultured Helicobacter sp.]|uniref:flagellar hook-basal body complex protein FliE n=1 Tax=uncultured Helicobacter sp. TaxID=175537 RepID=UPI002595A3D8|nr:flagellar hook-basal body complex protein FliE [uncultured Helicobacter sp.]